MIKGAHVVVYSKDAEADCVLFRDVLGFTSVDAGNGWLVFGLPAAESAFHPAETNDRHELYLMCGDLKTEKEGLRAKGINWAGVVDVALGLNYQDPAPGWRGDRPLLAQAPAA